MTVNTVSAAASVRAAMIHVGPTTASTSSATTTTFVLLLFTPIIDTSTYLSYLFVGDTQ